MTCTETPPAVGDDTSLEALTTSLADADVLVCTWECASEAGKGQVPGVGEETRAGIFGETVWMGSFSISRGTWRDVKKDA